ncbi:unnamed protein product [Amoebophrya sp. A25]|nr:unnamed protein product [Amoebophrya sp. A25]|eukprot:GSA25T00004449001.1
MDSKNMVPDVVALTRFLSVLDDWDEVEKYMERYLKNDSCTNTISNPPTTSRTRTTPGTSKVFVSFDRKIGADPDVQVHPDAALFVPLFSKCPDPEQLLARMHREFNVAPSAACVNAMLSALVLRKGEHSRALELWMRLPAKRAHNRSGRHIALQACWKSLSSCDYLEVRHQLTTQQDEHDENEEVQDKDQHDESSRTTNQPNKKVYLEPDLPDDNYIVGGPATPFSYPVGSSKKTVQRVIESTFDESLKAPFLARRVNKCLKEESVIDHEDEQYPTTSRQATTGSPATCATSRRTRATASSIVEKHAKKQGDLVKLALRTIFEPEAAKIFQTFDVMLDILLFACGRFRLFLKPTPTPQVCAYRAWSDAFLAFHAGDSSATINITESSISSVSLVDEASTRDKKEPSLKNSVEVQSRRRDTTKVKDPEAEQRFALDLCVVYEQAVAAHILPNFKPDSRIGLLSNGRQPLVLDLHGFSRQLAVFAVWHALRKHKLIISGDKVEVECDGGEISRTADRVLCFIAGRGKHSIDGEARIHPAVLSLFKEFTDQVQWDSPLPGWLRVWARKRH